MERTKLANFGNHKTYITTFGNNKTCQFWIQSKLPVLEAKNENSIPQVKIWNVAIKGRGIYANFGKLFVIDIS